MAALALPAHPASRVVVIKLGIVALARTSAVVMCVSHLVMLLPSVEVSYIPSMEYARP